MAQQKIGFFQAIAVVFRNRHQWRGTAGRKEFWKFQLFILILSNFFILPLDAVIWSYKIHSPVSSLWLALIIYINFCLVIRRTYDSGAPYYYALSGAGAVIGFMLFAHTSGQIWWFCTAFFVLSTVLYLWLMLLPTWDRDTPRGTERVE